MKYLKILPLLLTGLTVMSCATNGSSQSVENSDSKEQETTQIETSTNTNTELIPGVTAFDINYTGYEGKDNYAATKQGFAFEGILDDFVSDSWIVAGVSKPFDVLYNKEYIDFVVKIEDESVLKYEVKNISGNDTHVLTGLKTGTTKLKIYDTEENIIYRHTINVRIKIADPKLIFEKLATADYWVGVGYGAAMGNNYRLFLELNTKTMLYNRCTMSLVTAGPEAGNYVYEVRAESMKELHAGPFDMFSFDIKMINNQGNIIPLKFDVTQSLSTIIVSDKQGAIDMFRPMYLG